MVSNSLDCSIWVGSETGILKGTIMRCIFKIHRVLVGTRGLSTREKASASQLTSVNFAR